MHSSLKSPSPTCPTCSGFAHSPRGLLEQRSGLCFHSSCPPLGSFLRLLKYQGEEEGADRDSQTSFSSG